MSNPLAASTLTPVNSTGNVGLDILADAIAARVAARLRQSEEPRLLSVKEAAMYIGRTPKALWHLIGDGAVPVVREGARVHLDRADLDQWIEMRKVKR
jgi:excisionase family DNA binding protein